MNAAQRCGSGRAPRHRSTRGGRRHRPAGALLITGAIIASAVALSACTGSGSRGADPAAASQPAHGGAPAPSAASTPSAATSPATAPAPGSAATRGPGDDDSTRPAAIWNTQVVTWRELRPLLAERSGAVVLEDVFLDRQIESRLREKGLQPSAAQIAEEETILLEALDPDSSRARSLMKELRTAQGLGELRWNALLRRNAGLRLLVQPDVKITEEAILAAIDAAGGMKRRCRIIAVPDLRASEAVNSRLAAGESFTDLATELSTDRSAERGGLISPVSRQDPSFPAAFRTALWALDPGGTSAPILLDRGYVIIRFEREVPSTAANPSHSDAERVVRRAQERLLMENLARALLRDAGNATIFDDALQESWRNARDQSHRAP